MSGICHDACQTSADCPTGQSCVKDNNAAHCQLPAEADCSKTLSCSGAFVCAPDLRCRTACLSRTDCTTEQICVGGVCAALADLDPNGQLPQKGPSLGADGGTDGRAADAGGQGADLAFGTADAQGRDAGASDLAKPAPDAPISTQPDSGTGSDAKTADGGGGLTIPDAGAADRSPATSVDGSATSTDAARFQPANAQSCAGGLTCNGESCCTATVVPGGTLRRGYDGVTYIDNTYPATISAFALDRYEVTVGRFRSFMAEYPGNLPAAGAGKNPNNPADYGWNAAWNTDGSMVTITGTLSYLKCQVGQVGSRYSWTDTPGDNENKAMNCVTWYEAYAFCIWDGGRLPTEAEWNYAAAGGEEQRAFPWSVPPASTRIDGTYAVYDSVVSAVGSKSPKGDSKWGQADIAGNVAEWVLDWYATPYTNPCQDCANFTQASQRVGRGGSFYDSDPSKLLSATRFQADPTARLVAWGFRCARPLP